MGINLFTDKSNFPNTPLVEVVSKQINAVEEQLKEAYKKLEQSEIEKRRLIQQMNYLRLMELEVNELQALNRIVGQGVPNEEDIATLDRIIYKIRNHRLL